MENAGAIVEPDLGCVDRGLAGDLQHDHVEITIAVEICETDVLALSARKRLRQREYARAVVDPNLIRSRARDVSVEIAIAV